MADYLHALELQNSIVIGLRPVTNISMHVSQHQTMYAALQVSHQRFSKKCGVCCSVQQVQTRFRINCLLYRLLLDRPPNIPTRSSSIRLIAAAPPASPSSIIILLPVPLCNTGAVSTLQHRLTIFDDGC